MKVILTSDVEGNDASLLLVLEVGEFVLIPLESLSVDVRVAGRSDVGELGVADKVVECADVEELEAEFVEIRFPELEVEEIPLGIEVSVELDRVLVDEGIKLTLDSDVIDWVGETVSELYVDTVAVEPLELADSGLLLSEDVVAEADMLDAAEEDVVKNSVDESWFELEGVGAVDEGVKDLLRVSVELKAVEACDEVALSSLVGEEKVDDRPLELWRSLWVVAAIVWLIEVDWESVLDVEPILVESRELVKVEEYIELDESTEAVFERLADDGEDKSELGTLELLVVEESELVAEPVKIVEKSVGELDVPAIVLIVAVLDTLSVFEDSESDTGEVKGTLAEDEPPLSIELEIVKDADVVVEDEKGEEGLELSREIEDALKVVLISVIIMKD